MSRHHRMIPRRSFVGRLGAGAAVVAASSLAMPFIGRKANAGSGQVVISSWGGEIQAGMRTAFFEPFERETGITVVEQSYGMQGLAKLKAQVDAGGAEVDLLDGPPFWTAIGRNLGLTGSISYDDFGNQTDHMSAAFNEYGYSYGSVSWGIGYNKKSFPNGGPRNWAEFWDAEGFPGVRCMFAPIAARHIEYALMADGVEVGAVNPLDDSKVDRAFAKLANIKDHVGVWFTAFSQMRSLLLSQEIDVVEDTNGDSFVAQDRGAEIEFVFDEAVMNLLTWVMAKDAPNRENALKLLAFCSRPDRQAEFAKATYYGPTNLKALELIDSQTTLERLPTYSENLPKQVLLDGDYWSENLDKLKSRWQEITS